MKRTLSTLLAALFAMAALSISTGASARDRDHDDGPRWGHHERGWERHDHWDNRHNGHWNKHHHAYRDPVYIYGPPVVYAPPVVYERPYYSYPRRPSVVIDVDLPPIIIR